MYKNCTCLLTLQKVRLFHLTSHLSGASLNFSMRYCFRWKDSGKHVRPFQKTRTTFFKNMYVFSQKDYPVF